MADFAVHDILVPDEVYEAILSRGNHYWASITNRSNTGEIYITINGPDPAIKGAQSYLVSGYRAFRIITNEDVNIKLISSAALDFSVELFS